MTQVNLHFEDIEEEIRYSKIEVNVAFANETLQKHSEDELNALSFKSLRELANCGIEWEMVVFKCYEKHSSVPVVITFDNIDQRIIIAAKKFTMKECVIAILMMERQTKIENASFSAASWWNCCIDDFMRCQKRLKNIVICRNNGEFGLVLGV